jgi:hypothetical protein
MRTCVLVVALYIMMLITHAPNAVHTGNPGVFSRLHWQLGEVNAPPCTV